MSKKVNLEKSLNELEEIVETLEEGELGLEDSIKHFEKGVSLYKSCREALGKVETQIKVLTEELNEEDFE